MARTRLTRLVTWIILGSSLTSGVWTVAQVSQPPSMTKLTKQLCQAVARGQVRDVSALLTAGANPNPALLIAATNGQAEIFNLLIEHGVVLTGPDNLGKDALRMALYGSNKKAHKQKAKGPTDSLGADKVAVQIGGGYEQIIKLLLEHGVSANSPNELGMTPLVEATLYGNEVAVSLLLDHGASVDKELQGGETALYEAAWLGYGKIVELLLNAGASPNKADNNKVTPLLAAACAGDSGAEALAMGGESEGDSVGDFHGNDYAQAVLALLKANADVSTTGKKEITPLMAASAAGSLEIVAALLDAGADPNIRDKGGRTALMFAAKTGQAPLVASLLSSGADPKAVALDGKTALSIAKAGKSREAAKLLQKAMAR